MERSVRRLEYGESAAKERRRVYSFSPSVLASCGMLFAAGLLLGSYAPFAGVSPFGTALVMAAWFAGANPYAACLGAVIGYLICAEPVYAAACALMGGAVYLISSRRSTPRIYRLLILFGAELVFLLFAGAFAKLRAILLIGSACVSVFAAVVMGCGIRALESVRGVRTIPDTEMLTLSAFSGLLALCMRSFGLPSFSLAMVFSGACVMFASLRFGIGGLAFSVMLGAGRALAVGADMHFIAILASIALVAASLRMLGKWAVLAGFGAGSLIISFAVRGTGVFSPAEIAAACAIFAAVPQKLYMSEELKSSLRDPLRADRKYSVLQYRIASLAEVLGELARVCGDDGGPMLRAVSQTLRRCLNTLPRAETAYRAEFGVASLTKDGSPSSGDSHAVCVADEKLLLALSDGMGSGPEAKKESNCALALLSDLIKVGVCVDDAAACVNSLLASRGSGDMYATLDVMLVDLNDAQAGLSKHGAPSTFILRGGRLFAFRSEELPVGIIEDAPSGSRRIRLRDGDTVIMMTDGVCDALGEGLDAAVTDNVLSFGDAEMAAHNLLDAAAEHGREDDMTVIVARIIAADA